MKYHYTINIRVFILCVLLVLMGCCVAYCQDAHRVKLTATYPDSIQGICLVVEDWENAIAYFAPCWLKYDNGESFYEVKVPADTITEVIKFKEDIVIEDDIMLFVPRVEK